MNEAMREKEIAAYRQEILDTLERLEKDASSACELNYFFALARRHFAFDHIKQNSEVIILGTSLPEELVYASGAIPHWVLGGSARTGMWAGDMVPRDTDPVSRSMLGFLNNDFIELNNHALILIPVVNDSSRKLAYLLKRAGKKVHTIDVPPVKSADAASAWERQMARCGEVLSAHTGRPITAKALRRAERSVLACKLQMRRFLALTEGSKLTGPCRMFVLGSYYFADIEEWGRHLAALNAELGCLARQRKEGGNILLMGSPVYFPNYKIPFLIQDAGLHISAHVDYTTQKIFVPSLREFYQNDCSAAFPKNDAMLHFVSRLMAQTPIDGVIFQVLKGQIEYDFELERVEALCANHDLPVFRLETDYSAQDVEQLRIRVDAFTEMLTQRRYRKEAQAI